MANIKAKMKYRVVNGMNPRTKKALLRPIVVDRETYYIDQLVDYALNNGYVRGQFHDMRGALNGFVEAIQRLGKDGKAVNLSDWLRVHGELTGCVGQNRQLTDKNEYRVLITPLKELKRKATDFSWMNVDDNSLNPRIDKIVYLNGKNPNEIKVGVSIVATGANIFYNAGDTVVASWQDEDGNVHEIEIVPDEFSDAHQRFPWPEALSVAPVGTEVTFSFTFRGGVEGGAEKEAHHVAKIVAGDAPTTPKLTKLYPYPHEGEAAYENGLIEGAEFFLHGENLTDVTELNFTYMSTSDGMEHTKVIPAEGYEVEGGNRITVSGSFWADGWGDVWDRVADVTFEVKTTKGSATLKAHDRS